MTATVMLADDVRAAAEVVRRRAPVRPAAGIILGTGLGGLAEEIAVEIAIPYE